MKRSLMVILALFGCSEDPDNKETPKAETGPDTAIEETAPTGCPPPTGAPIEHSGNVEADQTWAAGIHHIKFSVGVRKNATLTLEPCAVVRVAPNYGIQVGTGNVGDGGTLIAKGTADRPVVIERLTTAWADVVVFPKGKVDLAYTRIVGGGAAGSRGGALLHIYGDQYQPLQALAKLDHVTLDGGAKYGLVTEGHGGLDPASTDLVIKGSAQMPAFLTAPSLGTLPIGTYTGNTTDAIRVSGTSAGEILEQDVAIHNRGVPYVVGGEGRFGELSVVGVTGTVPTLTIEAGVTIRFIKNGGLFAERATSTSPARAAIVIKGTTDKPVVLTSDEGAPAAGDWRGLWFGGVPSDKNNIEYARIEYAGGATGTANFSCGTPVRTDTNRNEAAIMILGQPASAFVKNSTILKSAANGIERGWRGTDISFLATNTFTEVAYCFETYPKDAMGSCPMTVPCPR
jgi:hypothetical protein